MTYEEVADTLEDFITGKGGDWDWDDYLNTTFSDPYLDHVQNRMNGLQDECPSGKRNEYCSPEGIQIIRTYIEELRTKAAMASVSSNIGQATTRANGPQYNSLGRSPRSAATRNPKG